MDRWRGKDMQEEMKQEDKTIETQETEQVQEKAEKQESQGKTAEKKTTQTAKNTSSANEEGKKNAKPAGRRSHKKTTESTKASSNSVANDIALAKKQEELDEANDRYKRLLSEFENARKRTEKETVRRYDEGAKGVLEKLLPVVDNFERALQSIPEEDKDRAFEQGVSAIYKQLMTTFEAIGVAPMNAEGKEFNPDLHNAVMHIEDETVAENTITQVLQKGYKIGDTIIRPAMVKVAN